MVGAFVMLHLSRFGCALSQRFCVAVHVWYNDRKQNDAWGMP